VRADQPFGQPPPNRADRGGGDSIDEGGDAGPLAVFLEVRRRQDGEQVLEPASALLLLAGGLVTLA
jgi:hypothetical protein